MIVKGFNVVVVISAYVACNDLGGNGFVISDFIFFIDRYAEFWKFGDCICYIVYVIAIGDFSNVTYTYILFCSVMLKNIAQLPQAACSLLFRA